MMEAMFELVSQLARAHSPVGNEREIDVLLRTRLEVLRARVWQDTAGNLIAHLPGEHNDYPLVIDAHKDELGLIIKRIEADGKLRVKNLGGAQPWKYGEGPMDILGDEGVVPAVLCFGSSHVTDESPLNQVRQGNRNLKWSDVYLDAKLTRQQLLERGIHAGCKAVVSRERKRPIRIGDYMGTYALDDKGAVAILLSRAEVLVAEHPPQDVYLVFSSTEENAGGGGPFAARTLPCDTYIAVEIAPVAAEYDLTPGETPVLVYSDARNVYNEDVLHFLARLAKEMGFDVQHAALESYATNAAMARSVAAVGRIAAVAFPCENTHGYEMVHLGSLVNLRNLLLAFVTRWPEFLQTAAPGVAVRG